MTGTMEGRKDDNAKDSRPGLIAPELIDGIGKVLAFGARKYSAGNWASGMAWSRPIDALDRHWTAWKGGERYDRETGYSHLWHMGCCLMFLVAYEARNIGRDDRAECGLFQGRSPPSQDLLTEASMQHFSAHHDNDAIEMTGTREFIRDANENAIYTAPVSFNGKTRLVQEVSVEPYQGPLMPKARSFDVT